MAPQPPGGGGGLSSKGFPFLAQIRPQEGWELGEDPGQGSEAGTALSPWSRLVGEELTTEPEPPLRSGNTQRM